MRSSNPHHPPLLPPAHIGLLLLLASTIILYKRNRMHSWKSLYSIHFTRSIQSLVVLVVPVEYCSNPSLSLSHTHMQPQTRAVILSAYLSVLWDGTEQDRQMEREKRTTAKVSGRAVALKTMRPFLFPCPLLSTETFHHFCSEREREERGVCDEAGRGRVCACCFGLLVPLLRAPVMIK